MTLTCHAFICFELKSVLKLQAPQKERTLQEAAGLDSSTARPQGFQKINFEMKH